MTNKHAMTNEIAMTTWRRCRMPQFVNCCGIPVGYSTTAAVKRAEKNPSAKNIAFAKSILQAKTGIDEFDKIDKIASETWDICGTNDDRLQKFSSLVKRLIDLTPIDETIVEHNKITSLVTATKYLRLST